MKEKQLLSAIGLVVILLLNKIYYSWNEEEIIVLYFLLRLELESQVIDSYKIGVGKSRVGK